MRSLQTPRQLEEEILELALEPSAFLGLGRSLAILREISPTKFRRVSKLAGLGSRKAYYLVELTGRLKEYSRHHARLARLGWTKCQLIGPYLTSKNVLDIIEFAEQSSVKQLDQYLRSGRTTGKRRCVIMYFSATDYRKVKDALMDFGAKERGRGLEGKEAAMMKAIDAASRSRRS